MTPRAGRPAPSKRATAAPAAAAERTLVRATARRTPTPTDTTAGPAPPARSGRASACVRHCAGGPSATATRPPPTTGPRLVRTHARQRRDDALGRLGDWRAPATVTKFYGTWASALTDAFADP